MSVSLRFSEPYLDPFVTQILFGQSMGGAFAIDLAGRHPDKVSKSLTIHS